MEVRRGEHSQRRRQRRHYLQPEIHVDGRVGAEYMSPAECPACHGLRLRPASLAVRVKNFSIAEFTQLPIARALLTVRNWEFGDRETQIAGRIVDEIRRRLEFLSAVGLDY